MIGVPVVEVILYILKKMLSLPYNTSQLFWNHKNLVPREVANGTLYYPIHSLHISPTIVLLKFLSNLEHPIKSEFDFDIEWLHSGRIGDRFGDKKAQLVTSSSSLSVIRNINLI